MYRKEIMTVLFGILLFTSSTAQCSLQSGPMPGYSEMREVLVWVQTTCEANVQMKYWEPDQPKNIKWSDETITNKQHGYTAHLIADQVEPGKRYMYSLLINGDEVALPYPTTFRSQSLWQWRTDPAPLRFVAGSCTYINEEIYDRPGPPYGGGYEIFESIRQEQPDLMIWLGDNIYLREVDWNTRTGIYHRYTHLRSLPALQPLLASTHHYAVWDDHDYGPNDSDRSFWAKDITLQAFQDFWGNLNYGAGGTEGITGTFFWEDCQFFMLDNRWYREPKLNATYFGDRQLKWLVEALRYSKSTFKFICTGGQILSDAAVFENFAQYPQERKALLDSLDKYNISGVIFLTGDRHHSEISKWTTSDGDIFYDVTSSALTSTTSAHPDEPNQFRVEGSMIGIRNYAVMEITGPPTQRRCTVTFKDGMGKALFTQVLSGE